MTPTAIVLAIVGVAVVLIAWGGYELMLQNGRLLLRLKTVEEYLRQRGVTPPDASQHHARDVEGFFADPPRSANSPANAPSTPPAGAAARDDQTVLILTPLKDAARFLPSYCKGLAQLSYPHRAISIGFLESDSRDKTHAELSNYVPQLEKEFRRVGVWKRDFGYRVPIGMHRGDDAIQGERRAVLARGRNHLLFHALDDEDWVMWLDVDIVEYPPDIIQRLIATGVDIVQPHCVIDYGGRTFDRNAWRDQGRLHLEDLRLEGDLVELHAVGATILLVRADVHREGLIFPTFPYGVDNPFTRQKLGEVETEGLGIMARDMGYRCWGMPNLEIRHARH